MIDRVKCTRSVALLMGVAAVGLSGCRSAEVRSTNEAVCFPPLPEQSAAPIQLVSCPIDIGEDRLAFFVGVRNLAEHPLRVRLRFEPRSEFDIRVRRLGEGVVLPADLWEGASIGLEPSTYVLPRGGVAGRIMDVSCLQRDFGPELEPCGQLYDFRPGEYEVSFEYRDIWVCLEELAVPCDPTPTWSGTLESVVHHLTIR